MEKKENKKNIVSLVVLCVSIVALTTSLTYAYFTSQMGVNEEEKITVTSGRLALTFRDNDDTVDNLERTWNFGDTVEKELVIENTGTRDTYAKISWDNLTNTYLAESLTYTLEQKTDETDSVWTTVETEGTNVPRSETSSTQVLADHIPIPAGHTYTYRLIITLEDLPTIDQTADLNATFATKFTIAETTAKLTTADKLVNLGIKINPTNKTTGFETPATTDETKDGLFSMVDDYGTSYYYRGTAPNNYLKFGQNKSGQDMWWRIIRINGDGTIRMQYDGAGAAGANTYTERFALTDQRWNLNRNDAKYVGWMFGGTNGTASTSREQAQTNETNSEIKTKVDTWYKENIEDTGYSSYVADAIFCNDRSTPGETATGFGGDTGLGYGKNYTAYGAYARFLKDKNNPQPQFTCPEKNDAFTVEESEKGNGALEYPVGLITADEIVAAGSGTTTINQSYYLYRGSWYWSFSPSNLDASYHAYVFSVYHVGSLSRDHVLDNGAVAPVINLKAEYLNQLKGTGISTDPFRLS